jgi:hypothetical protein
MGAKHKHKNVDTTDSVTLTYSWTKFTDVPLFYIICSHMHTNISSRSFWPDRVESLCHGLLCLLYCNSMNACTFAIIEFQCMERRTWNSCLLYQCFRALDTLSPAWDTSMHGTKTRYFWIETSFLGIILWQTNFNQEYVGITLSIVSSFLCLQMPLLTFNIAFVNLTYYFYIPLY